MITLDFTVHCSYAGCSAQETFQIDLDQIGLDLNNKVLSLHIPIYDKGWKTETVEGCGYGREETYHYCPNCKEKVPR